MILPIIFGALVFLPGMFILDEILIMLGSSIDAPFRELPYPEEIKFSALMLLFTAFFTFGNIVGMFMNALVLRTVYKWKKKDIINALVHSKYPDHWLKLPEEQLKADILLAKARQKGKWHFITAWGVVGFGPLIFLISALAPALSSDSPINYDILFMLACLWLSIGVLFGWVLWKTLIDADQNQSKPESPDASYINYEAYRLGCRYYNQGEFSKASEVFEEAVAYRPEDGKSWMALGNCFEKFNKLVKAEECYRSSLAHISEEFKPNAMFNLANNLFDQSRFLEAIELYRNVPESSDVYSKAQNNLMLAENRSATAQNQPKQPGLPQAAR